MFCQFNNLFISSIDQLSLLNINAFDYVLNISNQSSNIQIDMYPNVFNYNIDFFNNNSHNDINSLYDFIISQIYNKKILLINNENNNADVFFIFFLMKFYNKNYDIVFNMLQLNIDLSLKKKYSFLRKFIHGNNNIENNISNSDLMDVC
jgi:hypothetical protein